MQNRMDPMKPEQCIMKKPLSSSLELSCAKNVMYQKVMAGFRKVCIIYVTPFKDSLYAVEQSGDEVTERAQALSCKGPYSNRLKAEFASSEYDQICLKYLSDLCIVMSVFKYLRAD